MRTHWDLKDEEEGRLNTHVARSNKLARGCMNANRAVQGDLIGFEEFMAAKESDNRVPLGKDHIEIAPFQRFTFQVRAS